ncbi:hypothetical protein MLD38_035535 [Melastoma candidum]|uniref:Uncharacterized protein n=1 Tax=Melastoma candidum TaxID=119954 RepID=A0ACB9LH45_9MYRT|nr:hypothetical protein MLD38_035535 [Melastoma candidum]
MATAAAASLVADASNGSTTYDRMKAIKEFDEAKIGVKGLSDSGADTIPEFFRHPQSSLSDLKPVRTSVAKGIPVIDLSSLNDLAQRPKIVQQVKDAAKTWGFFQVVNHGVATSVLDSTLEAVKNFHELPHEVKSKYYKREEFGGVMYTSNNDLYRSSAACWHDSIQAWLSPMPLNEEDLPEVCRKEVVAWNGHVKGVGEAVMELLSEGLGLDKGKFKELSFPDVRVFVGHYYPYCPQSDLTMGITSHTDPGVVTVLLPNEVKGLQVRHDGEWVEIEPVHGGLIVNVGDFLQIVSNGEYRSVEHRVIANGSKEPRVSAVVFFNLYRWREGDVYGPLPELVSADRPAIYRDFTKEEFNSNFYSKGLDSKSFVDKIKIVN